jgi:SET domain
MEQESSHHQRSHEDLIRRLAYLEQWRELAIRPSMDDAFAEDHDLLLVLVGRPTDHDEDDDDEEEYPAGVGDDLPELTRRCLAARQTANAHLPLSIGPNDAYLEVRTSGIPGAGQGLFVIGGGGDTPPPSSSGHHRGGFAVGETICYYYGHVHNYRSAATLADRSYLLHIHGNLLVDAGPLPFILARYINDPCHEGTVNVKFVPDIQQQRVAVVAFKYLEIGQELFVDYGDAYWSQQQPTMGYSYCEEPMISSSSLLLLSSASTAAVTPSPHDQKE